MTDGLLLSAIGLASVFAILTIIMLLVRILVRLLRNGEVPVEQAAVARAGAALVTGATKTPEEVATGEAPASTLVGAPEAAIREPEQPGIEGRPGPRDAAEVAAIAVGVAARMRGQGRDWSGPRIVIDGAQYEVNVGDPWQSPVAVMVNGELCWTSLDGSGLPAGGGKAPLGRARGHDARSDRLWRSAYPFVQEGYWDRRGWG